MAENRVICHCNDVDYITIRKAMINGARTLEEIMDVTGASTACGGCIDEINEILLSACSCNNVSMKDVVKAVNDGADTVEKVGEVTGAGSACGRCQALVANVIELKK